MNATREEPKTDPIEWGDWIRWAAEFCPDSPNNEQSLANVLSDTFGGIEVPLSLAKAIIRATEGWYVYPIDPATQEPVKPIEATATRDLQTICLWFGPDGPYEEHGVGVAEVYRATTPHRPPYLARNDDGDQIIQPLPYSGRFEMHSPADDAAQPPLAYWDDQRGKRCILPRVKGGCAIIEVGNRSGHKTGIAIKEALDACLNKGAHVLYLAAEGAHGIRTARLPAVCQYRGIDLAMLTGRWVTLAATPHLPTDSDVDETIEACRLQRFAPDIIVIDTLTRAARGSDINHPAIGVALITGMERLAQAFDAAVIAITHPPKDENRGATGSKLIEDLAFAIWRVRKLDDRTVRLWVDKMKDGPAEFSVAYRVAYAAGSSVPVIIDLPAGERAKYGVADDPKLAAALDLKRDVLRAIRQHEDTSNFPITVMASLLSGDGGYDSDGRETNATHTMRMRLTRAIGDDAKAGILADLMQRDKHGRMLLAPRTFRSWPEVRSIAEQLGLSDEPKANPAGADAEDY